MIHSDRISTTLDVVRGMGRRVGPTATDVRPVMPKMTSYFRMSALLALSIAVGAAANLQAKAAVSECADIDDPARLLECYANLAKKREAEAARAENKSPFVLVRSDSDSGWRLSASELSGDHWRRLNLRVYAKNFWVRSDDQRKIAHLADLRPSLWFRCVNGKMSGFIDWGIFLDIEKAKIVFRYDNEPTQVAMVQVSEDHKKVESLSEDRLIARIKEMFGKNTLTASVTPLGEEPLAVSFNISGLENAIKPLRESCHW